MSTMTAASGSGAPMGVLCALPEELRLFRAEVADPRVESHGATDVVLGTLDGIPVAMAETGIGKVNAAATATLLCDRYACNRLLVSGVAGALDPALSIGDVVVGNRVIQHDFGRLTDDGFTAYRPGDMPFPGASDRVGWSLGDELAARVRDALGDEPLPGVRARDGGARHVPAIHFGTILTGDAFIAGDRIRRDLLARYGALVVEMEGGAVVQVAERYGARWLVVRAVSDLAGHDGAIDFAIFLDDAAHTAATLLRRLAPVL
jgi:adenosylhomocysteine nucleosidase